MPLAKLRPTGPLLLLVALAACGGAPYASPDGALPPDDAAPAQARTDGGLLSPDAVRSPADPGSADARAADGRAADARGGDGRAEAAAPPDAVAKARPAGWTEETHGKSAPPRYDRALPAGRVPRIDLRIAAKDWAAMQADLTQMLGKFGSGGLVLPPPGSVTFLPRQPIYVPATVGFEGKVWTSVGMRYRGNGSLAGGWRKGTNKLSFNLSFDKFEERAPETEDQRFFGLKTLALICNPGDPSQLRQKVAGDLFHEAGVPTPRSAFYRVFVDRGDGPVYFGLYTAVEVPEKEMLKAAFGSGEGNLYKPDGEGAKLQTFDAVTLEKKTNEKAADFSDVKALIAAVNADRSDKAAWRARLERVLDVEGFLRWLAVNTVIQNWDTYGRVPHNYYLYGSPTDGRMHWVPWDLTESFKATFLLLVWAPSMSLKDVGAEWPLIRHVMDDPVYRVAYVQHVARFAAGSFAGIEARLRAEHALVAPYVVGPEGEREGYTQLDAPEKFTRELDALLSHVKARAAAAAAFVKQPAF